MNFKSSSHSTGVTGGVRSAGGTAPRPRPRAAAGFVVGAVVGPAANDTAATATTSDARETMIREDFSELRFITRYARSQNGFQAPKLCNAIFASIQMTAAQWAADPSRRSSLLQISAVGEST